jgi:hypothetical protein
MQKARGQNRTGPEGPVVILPLLVGIRFQVLFHSPPGVLFTFPSQYLCAIGRLVVLSLRRWSSRIPTGFPVSRSTWEPHRREPPVLSPTGLSPASADLSRVIRLERRLVTPRPVCTPARSGPTTPAAQRVQALTYGPVWANPRSLAATEGVAIAFLSWGY